MNVRFVPVAMGAIAVVALAGCVSREEVPGGAVHLPSVPLSGEVVSVVARDYHFDANVAVVAPGRTVFSFENHGQEIHELAIVPFDSGRYGLPVAEIEGLKPGDSAALQVGLREGSYRMVCLLTAGRGGGTVSHFSLGQEYVLEVRR